VSINEFHCASRSGLGSDTFAMRNHLIGVSSRNGKNRTLRLGGGCKRLYIHGNAKQYPTLGGKIGGNVNVKQIRAHWDEILRLAALIKQGTVTASLMLRKLGSYPRQNGLAVARRELGRIERTRPLMRRCRTPGSSLYFACLSAPLARSSRRHYTKRQKSCANGDPYAPTPVVASRITLSELR
jgi:hypothetical protein